jgi:hypothetical protein
VFALDLLFWCVTLFSLLTLFCSASFVAYFAVRKMLEMVFAASLLGVLNDLTRLAPSEMLPTSSGTKMFAAALRGDAGAPNAAAIAGPWGPIDRGLSPETVQMIDRVMAVGIGMRDAAGNLCPHPIAPRVALAIVEALQGQR